MPDFPYETLNTTQHIDRTEFKNNNGKSYEYYITNDAPFAIFEYPQTEWADHTELQSPWKIHLNVSKEQVAEAWDLIHPFLLEQEVPSFKVSRLSKAENADVADSAMAERVSEGAQITIYIPKGKEYEYNQLIAQIEQKFLEKGIQPGRFADSDKKVGVFTSVRGAGIPGDEITPYVEATQATNYNPHHLDDPFVMQESKLVAQFTQALAGYLTAEYAKGRIRTAIGNKDAGMLTRLFDRMEFDGNELLANTRAAAAAGNLEGYLSQFARGCARQLFNDDLSDLHPTIKDAIGTENYDNLIQLCGTKEELVKKVLQATIALHTQILTSAFEKEQGMTMEDVDAGKRMTEEQNEAFRKLSEQITVPSDNFLARLDPQVLLQEKFSAKSTPDSNNEEKAKALEEIQHFRDKVVEIQTKLDNYIRSLQKWGVLKDKSEKNVMNGEKISELQKVSAAFGNFAQKLTDDVEGMELKFALPGTTPETINETLQNYKEKYTQQIAGVCSGINITIFNPRERHWLEEFINRVYQSLNWGEYEFPWNKTAKTTKEAQTSQDDLKSSLGKGEETKPEPSVDETSTREESPDEEHPNNPSVPGMM